MAIMRGNLSGTKDGSNVSFTLPVVPIVGSEQIIWSGNVLHPVGSFSAVPTLECIISGQDVTLGSAPGANDALHYICDVA